MLRHRRRRQEGVVLRRREIEQIAIRGALIRIQGAGDVVLVCVRVGVGEGRTPAGSRRVRSVERQRDLLVLVLAGVVPEDECPVPVQAPEGAPRVASGAVIGPVRIAQPQMPDHGIVALDVRQYGCRIPVGEARAEPDAELIGVRRLDVVVDQVDLMG